LVFGYNGLERFDVLVPGAISAGPGVMVQFNGGNWAGTTYQLFGSEYGPQIAWLVPLSLLALVAGLVACGRARRADPLRAGLVMWGIWLVTFGVVFSEIGLVTHTAYVASFAPPVAALSGAGIVMFWRWYRAGDWRGLVLPLAVAAEVAWAVRLWSFFPTFLPWARQVLIVVGAFAVVALVTAWPWRRHPRSRLEGVGSSTRGGSAAGVGTAAGSRTGAASGPGGVAGTARTGAGARAGIRGRLAAAGLATGVAAMLAAPAAWALSVLDVAYAGTSFDAIAGPSGAPYAAHIHRAMTTVLGGVDRRIYTYVSAHRGGTSYLMAAQDWDQASPYILATGQEVLPLGGFSGLAPEPTLAHVQQLVGSGQLRFFQLGGGHAGAAARGNSFERIKIISWVVTSCRVIPPKDYGGISAANTRPSSGLNGRPVTLYECGTGG